MSEVLKTLLRWTALAAAVLVGTLLLQTPVLPALALVHVGMTLKGKNGTKATVADRRAHYATVAGLSLASFVPLGGWFFVPALAYSLGHLLVLLATELVEDAAYDAAVRWKRAHASRPGEVVVVG